MDMREAVEKSTETINWLADEQGPDGKSLLNDDELTALRALIEFAETHAQCPLCGYTLADARRWMDHHLCKNYPYFSDERKETGDV